MELKLARSLWGAPASLAEAVQESAAAGFDAIEGPLPESPAELCAVRSLAAASGLGWIAEVTTGLAPGGRDDWWVPSPAATVGDHLRDLRAGAQRAADFGAWFVSTMCGYDAWSLHQNVDFFGAALEIGASAGLPVHFETHRCRSLFNPWITRDLLLHFPEMTLTCDFSHWCVVAERLIDSEEEILRLCAGRAGHVHARVGYAQGAQVPDPRAPRYGRALEAHERWWSLVWSAREARGEERCTMNVEWGPDGYTPLHPHTDEPLVDRWEIILWMAARQRSRFQA
jgi:sugar phosphate isomerase/epimerase